jgi:hypothetical protein
MQYLNEYSIPLTVESTNGVKQTLYFKEVPVAGTNYFKLVTQDEFVAVLVSIGFTCEWSAYMKNHYLRKQMILDSHLVQYVASQEFKECFSKKKRYNDQTREHFKKLMPSFFSENIIKDQSLNVVGFSELVIQVVPENSIFRITEYDGSESIEILDLDNYMTA